MKLASENETVAEIVSRMREGVKDWRGERIGIYDDFADRIEAAHRRELEHQAVHNCELRAKSGLCGLMDEIKAHWREVAELKTAYDRAVSADARHAVDNERLKREVAELHECLRVSSNAMEMVVQWLGRYPKWQDELKYLVAENRKALEGAEDEGS